MSNPSKRTHRLIIYGTIFRYADLSISNCAIKTVKVSQPIRPYFRSFENLILTKKS